MVLAGFFILAVNYFFGVDFIRQSFIAARASAGVMMARYIDYGLGDLDYAFQKRISIFLNAFAAFGSLALLALAWIFCGLSSRSSGKKKLKASFERFRLSQNLIWVLIVSGLLFLTGGFLKQVGINLGVFLLGLYFIGGVAVALFFMRLWDFNSFMKWLLVVAMVMTSGFYFFTALGIADVWFNFRRKSGGAKKS